MGTHEFFILSYIPNYLNFFLEISLTKISNGLSLLTQNLNECHWFCSEFDLYMDCMESLESDCEFMWYGSADQYQLQVYLTTKSVSNFVCDSKTGNTNFSEYIYDLFILVTWIPIARTVARITVIR